MERDLEFLKSKIPKEVYEANKEKYDAKLDELEETDPKVEEDEDEETQASDDESIEKEEEDEEEQDEGLEEQDVERLGTAFPEIEDDNDDEEDDDEFYLQKFDETTQQKIIADFHPELQSHNYDEIDVLSRVVRDENGNIVDLLHKTIPVITRY